MFFRLFDSLYLLPICFLVSFILHVVIQYDIWTIFNAISLLRDLSYQVVLILFKSAAFFVSFPRLSRIRIYLILAHLITIISFLFSAILYNLFIIESLYLGWCAQRSHNYKYGCNPDFSRCVMLLPAYILGFFVLLRTLSYDFVMHSTPVHLPSYQVLQEVQVVCGDVGGPSHVPDVQFSDGSPVPTAHLRPVWEQL